MLVSPFAAAQPLWSQPPTWVSSADSTRPAGAKDTSAHSADARVKPLSSNAAHAAAPTISAKGIKRAVSIDGRLDDEAWADAQIASEFRQTDPIDGGTPSQRTEVRILYDDAAIYIGARLYDSTGKISSRLGRRDADLNDSDWFIVVLDSYHDHTGGFRFKVNPAGIIGDEANGDRGWNPVWTVATSVDGTGWTAEIRIPFSQLRFSPADQQVWGVQFYREIRATAEKLVFSYSPKSDRGGPSRFGHLLGLQDIKRGKTLEVLPYVSASAQFREVPVSANTSFNNPFRDGSDFARQVGADIKYRLTSNFTLDATLNPDFGQIEADESQVNLSANELFLREQRPFFVEGSSTFRFGTGVGGGGFGGFGGGGGGGGGGMSQLLYSRRIGRAPQGSVPSASRYSNIPEATTILGAAKITGRTAKGWSLGIMEAVTGSQEAPWVDSVANRFTTQVEPNSNYFVARVKKDLREGQSNVGVIFTSVHRQLGDSALAQRLRSSAYVSGLDFGHLFAHRTWEFSGSVVGSLIDGDSTVIISAQRASSRFFNRPDASYLDVDSTLTQLRGWTGSLGLSKNNGLHWTGNVRVNAVSPGYEINDLGFLSTSDRVTVNGGLNYDENQPGKRFRKWGMGLRPEVKTNFGGDVVNRVMRGDVDAQLLNFIGGRLNLSHDFSSLDDRLTRGGPLSMSVPSNNISFNVYSDGRKPYTWNVSASERWDEAGGWGQSREIKFGFKPSDWWSGEVGPKYNRNFGTAQYITSVRDTTARSTFGRRYIFSEINQTTVSLQTRLNLTMSPRLTFALVAEPFVASGKYGTPKQLRAPRQFEFDTYGVDAGTVAVDTLSGAYTIDPDGKGPAAAFTVSDRSFNTRSMNATGNLRWEWRPGSTLFLVWQHRRSNPAAFGNFDFNRDFRGIFGNRSENIFLFKVSYWLNP